MSTKTRKPLGILSGANFSMKKTNRNLRRLVEAVMPTIPLLPTGLPAFSAKCAENSPYNPDTIKYHKQAQGNNIIMGLLSKFKV